MAKRKDSVALFEVITATKKKEAAAAAAAARAAVEASKPAPAAQPAALRTPKWWFKGKPKANTTGGASAPAVYHAPALPAPVENDPTQFAPATYAPAAYDPTTAAPPPGVVQRVVPPAPTYAPPPQPERVTIPMAAPAEHVGMTVDPFGLEHPAPAEPAYPAKPRQRFMDLARGLVGGAKADPERREVTVRFRYTTAIVVGFALCVAVGLAYVTGRQANKAKATATGVTSDAVKRGPILAGVLDPTIGDRTLSSNASDADSKEADTTTDQPPKERTKPVIPSAAPTGTQQKPAVPDNKLPGESAGVTRGLPRTIGLNYVVVQSYPDRKSAEDAAKALEEAGVPCGVVQGLRDFAAPNFFSVVGTHGFSSMRNSAAYKQYEQSIRDVSKAYAGTSKYKKFEPTPYKWKAQ